MEHLEIRNKVLSDHAELRRALERIEDPVVARNLLDLCRLLADDIASEEKALLDVRISESAGAGAGAGSV